MLKNAYTDMQEKQRKRYEPLERTEITKIYRTIKNEINGETGLTVSLQLQEYARLKKLESTLNEIKRKTDGEILREIAEKLDEQDNNVY